MWFFFVYPNKTSINPAPTIANAPSHCKVIIFSAGIRSEALIIATITSDIMRSPTRPGNKTCETLNIIIKLGKKIKTDQTIDDGKTDTTKEKFGVLSLYMMAANKKEKIVVAM